MSAIDEELEYFICPRCGQSNECCVCKEEFTSGDFASNSYDSDVNDNIG